MNEATQQRLNMLLRECASTGLAPQCLQLLQRGADVRDTDDAGYTALHLAASENRTDICWLLVQHGCPVDVVSKYGFTPLAIASSCNAESACMALVALGAQATPAMRQDADGALAMEILRLPRLHAAAAVGLQPLCLQLLQQGFDPRTQDLDGVNAMEMALARGQPQTADFLRSWVANQEARRAIEQVARLASGLRP